MFSLQLCLLLCSYEPPNAYSEQAPMQNMLLLQILVMEFTLVGNGHPQQYSSLQHHASSKA